MRLRQFASLLAALLLLAALAMPAYAAPTTNVVVTTETAENSDARILSEDEVQQMIAAAVADLQPETTVGIAPIDDYLFYTEDGADLLSQRNMTLAALALSGLAVLLSVVALVRTRKKTAPNATGNYQKYF